jgi:predicted enzyme related to lactoylglutathione lyase
MTTNIATTDGPLTHGRIDAILIFARDMDKMLRFYRDTLGLKVRFANAHFAELAAGGGAGIALHAGLEPSASTDGDVMIEFTVDDIETCARLLSERGVKVDPIRTETFGKIAQLRDPEGHRIGLEQPAR